MSLKELEYELDGLIEIKEQLLDDEIDVITAQPYFTIPNEVCGAGWVNGNLLRFTALSNPSQVTFTIG